MNDIRRPYEFPFPNRGPDNKAYIGVYRGYHVLLGSEIAMTNGWLLAGSPGGRAKKVSDFGQTWSS